MSLSVNKETQGIIRNEELRIVIPNMSGTEPNETRIWRLHTIILS